MRVAAIGPGVLLVLAGIVWLLQGLNVLPGSFMTGQPFWAFIGVVCLVLGGGLIYWGLLGAGRKDG
ncbi:MAG: hypothetical protein M3441_13875 [Chloroflexota bacterium]|nr:hypothetical protein [Chloroflexota bacterium]